ncbi:MAG: hydratase, partial [Bacillota bacterium]
MIELFSEGVYLHNGVPVAGGENFPAPKEARENTIAYSILQAHNRSDRPDKLRIKFDKLISHDITYVGIIQTARGSGLTE